jgi:flagellar hook-associated protein 3 FlgL
MRVTQNTTSNLVLQNLQTILERQTQLEQYSSTGYKVNVPGDDPVAAQQILHLKSLTNAQTQYARNITNASSVLTMSDSAMSGMGDVLSRTKEIALEMANATNNSDSQAAALKEVEQLKSQMVMLGNTQLNGKYIFGGFQSDKPPFDTAGNFTPASIDNVQTEIDTGSQMSVNYSGATLISGGIPAGSTGVDIMSIFDRLSTALTNGSVTGVQAELGNLDSSLSQVLVGRSVMGASINRLTSVTSVSEDTQLATSKVLSKIQDVDITQVISDLAKQATAYETAIAASAKVAQMTLLDYLR